MSRSLAGGRAPAPLRGARVILGAITALAAVAVLLAPRVAQDPAFHDFADRRVLLGIPNGLDVLSNLPFAVVGMLGLRFVFRGTHGRRSFLDPRERRPFIVLFAGVSLVSLGSSYYHLAPNNERLMWDRLPITLGFMSIFTAVVSERLSPTLGRRLLAPLLLLGLVSVLHWHWTERAGAGDLRLYGLVQFYPMLAVPLMLLLFPPRYTRGVEWVGALLLYGVAKLVEIADARIFSMGRIVSGHTLKHVIAAAAVLWILRMLEKRRPVEEPAQEAR